MSSRGKRFDAVVVGAGPNGLVAALRLARAGRSVLVAERRDRLGGLAAAEEFHPGSTAPGLLHSTAGFREEIARELELGSHGLAFRAPPPVYVPVERGEGLVVESDPEAARQELEAHAGAAEAEAYAAWRALLGRFRPLVRQVMAAVPPPLDASRAADFWQLGKRGLALRRLGRQDMLELLRLTPMCAADWLNETFASEALKEALAAPAVAGTFMGPWSAGSAATLLLGESSAGREVEGGPAALVRALAKAARAQGVELRTGAAVEEILLGAGGVRGVRLADGTEVETGAVAAACDPKTALLDLLPPGALPLRVEEQVASFRTRGTTAKVHLALTGPLEFAGRPGKLFEAARIGGGHLDALERAFDAVKYRRFSERPQLDVRVPTVADPSLAPEGCHVVSILVSFAPYTLEGGWTPQAKEALGEAVVEQLARHAPSVRERIAAREVLTPADIEERYGTTGGHLDHGEHALDQLLMLRPVPSCARYATPVEGLFLAGSGSHPGGGLTGLPGWLGAGVVQRWMRG